MERNERSEAESETTPANSQQGHDKEHIRVPENRVPQISVMIVTTQDRVPETREMNHAIYFRRFFLLVFFNLLQQIIRFNAFNPKFNLLRSGTVILGPWAGQ